MSSVKNTSTGVKKVKTPSVVLRLSMEERKGLFAMLKNMKKAATKSMKEAAKEAKKAEKEAEKESKKAAKEAEKESKKATKEAEKEAKKALKGRHTEAIRECVSRLTDDEKVELAERYLLAVVPGADIDDVDAASKKVKAGEWRKMVQRSWNDNGIPAQYENKYELVM